MKKLMVGLSLLLSISLLPAHSATPPKAGSTCSKQGITKTYKGKIYKCKKAKGKLVWSKGKVVKQAAPVPRPSATSSPTPNPSPSISPSTTPTPTPTPSPIPTKTTLSASESLQQYIDAEMVQNRCDFKKVQDKKVLGIDIDGSPTYLQCNQGGFWRKNQNELPQTFQPKININDFSDLTFPWKSPCQPDPWVPTEWKAYEQFAIKYFSCSRPMRFVEVSLPTTKPISPLTPQNELNSVSICKIPDKPIKNVAGNTHNVGHRNSWKFAGDLTIQVVPVEFTDFKGEKSPTEEYGKYMKYMEEMFYKISDGNTRIKMKIPSKYIEVNAALSSFDTGETLQKNSKFSWKKLDTQKLQNAVFTAADRTLDFTGIKVTILLVPLSVPDNYIAHGGGFRMDNVQTNEGIVPSTYIMPPANTNSDNDWYGVEPFLHLHEMFHATGMLSDHLGDQELGGTFYGTGNWGHMSGMLTDHLTWDKWLTGMLADTQVICGKKSGTGHYWIKPATYYGPYEKLLVIPLSETKVIAVESQRAAGMNFKLTRESQGALVYTLDVMDTRYDGGFEVIKPANRTTATIEGPFIFFDAPLKLNESVSIWGYKISVIESGDFGDVIKVEKVS